MARVYWLLKSERDKKRKIRKMEKGKRLQPRKKRKKKIKKVEQMEEQETRKNWLDFQLDDVLRDSIKHSDMMAKTKKKKIKGKVKGKKKDVKSRDKSKKSMLTLMEQLDKILPSGQVEGGTYAQKRKQIFQICKDSMLKIVDQACLFGESLLLNKQIQKKFQNRPVNKNVFIKLKNLDEPVIDIMPQSLCVSPLTGRLLYLDKEGIFYQYDISNREKCRPINISSRIPLNQSQIIDVVFNEKTSSFYTLNRNWILEVWELHQNISVPVASMKVITEIFED